MNVLLHVQAVLALRLAFLKAHLLKEDIRAIVDPRRVTRVGARLGPEVGQLLALDVGDAALRGNVLEERGLRDLGLGEVRVDLAADLVAAGMSAGAARKGWRRDKIEKVAHVS